MSRTWIYSVSFGLFGGWNEVTIVDYYTADGGNGRKSNNFSARKAGTNLNVGNNRSIIDVLYDRNERE
jgi:hypothetical protein